MTEDRNMPTSAIRYNADDIARFKRLYAPDHTPDELTAFFGQVERTQLDPWARQIYSVKRYNQARGAEVAQTQVSIDGFRLQAERTGDYAGQTGPFWCGEDGVWKDVWTGTMQELVAAKVGVIRKGFSEPLFAVARFAGYAQKKKDGALTMMWLKMGDVMIAKCAEALALRRAFPAELSGLYTPEEMLHADPAPAEEAPKAPAPRPQAARPAPPAAPAAPTPATPAPAPATTAPAPTAAEAEEPLEDEPPAQAAVESFEDLAKEIQAWKTVEKANAGIPVILSLEEPMRAAAQQIFRTHRMAMRWEIGTIDGALQVTPLAITEWTDIKRASAGLSIIEAMTGDERAEALEKLKAVCHEQGWTLKTAPKLSVTKK